jgi:hypothetical protein
MIIMMIKIDDDDDDADDARMAVTWLAMSKRATHMAFNLIFYINLE